MKLPALPPLPNRDDRTLLPALLAGMLVLMLALQFALPAVDELPADAGRVVPVRGVDAAIARVIPDPAITRNALFSPTRGGAANGAGDDGPGPMGGATLAGIVKVGNRARAVVQQSDGTVVSVAVGGRYQAWTLVALSPTTAKFARDGEQWTLAVGGGAVLPNSNDRRPRPEER